MRHVVAFGMLLFIAGCVRGRVEQVKSPEIGIPEQHFEVNEFCVDGRLFSSLEDEIATCAVVEPNRRSLDEYTATTYINNYEYAFTLDNTNGDVHATMTVGWEILTGSASWGYKSILDPTTGTGVSDVSVVDGDDTELTYTTYKNDYGWTMLKFWFGSPLSAADSTTIVVTYTINKGTSCQGDHEKFSFIWANYWRCDVTNIVYYFGVDDPDDFHCEEYTIAVSPSSSDFANAETTKEGCGKFSLSQKFSSDDLDISLDPNNVFFKISPALRECDEDEDTEDSLSTGAIVGICIGTVAAVLFCMAMCFCSRWNYKRMTPNHDLEIVNQRRINCEAMSTNTATTEAMVLTSTAIPNAVTVAKTEYAPSAPVIVEASECTPVVVEGRIIDPNLDPTSSSVHLRS